MREIQGGLDTASAPDNAIGWDELPDVFMELVRHSLRLQNLVRRMDEEIYGYATTTGASPLHRRTNPVSDQINLLATAFAR